MLVLESNRDSPSFHSPATFPIFDYQKRTHANVEKKAHLPALTVWGKFLLP
jgi:hypothetical protein